LKARTSKNAAALAEKSPHEGGVNANSEGCNLLDIPSDRNHDKTNGVRKLRKAGSQG
jgi:hypothetical protein